MKHVPSELELWYETPAASWVEALPLGNGRIGAMVFGKPEQELIQLNEGTLWGGGPHDYTHPDASEVLAEIRRLIFEGKFAEAADLGNSKFMSRPLGQLPYQTLGNLQLDVEGASGFTEYRRSLDLDAAVCATTYLSNGVQFAREAFVSHPDQVLVIRLTADKPKSVGFKLTFDGPQQAAASAGPDAVAFEGIASAAEGIPGETKFCALARVIPSGGTLSPGSGSLSLTGADSATIVLSLATSYVNYRDVTGDARKAAQTRLDAAGKKHFETLLRNHTRDHQRLFRRVRFHLPTSAPERSTSERIADFSQGKDLGLAALYFQYGRYLLIACSRPGGQPATLQGLWNDSLTPPWGSKYTVNINTEMNYWPAETCGLTECCEPLFAMLHEVAETGNKTAKVHYNAGGWVLHHNTDGWRGSAPIDGASWGIWPTGGAWLCTHMWEHYRFTGDRTALARDYPVLKGAVEFFLETLVPLPTTGQLVTCPSTSPENSHHPGVGLCAGPTMDLFILRDLFDAFVGASEVLKQDAEMAEHVRETHSRLAAPQIGHLGQLQEWLEDWDADAPEIHHRHVSHLYGLFPSHQILPEDPTLFNAAKRSLELRGDAGTGWSLAWKINLWARLLDGDHCLSLIHRAIRPEGTDNEGGGVYPNLFDAHPPFQIDGNFGYASGIAEMLVQSHAGQVRLLPALPSAWAEGSILGLRARGGHVVDIEWADGALKTATVHIGWSGSAVVRYKDRTVEVEGAVGEPIVLEADQFEPAEA